MHFLDMPRKLRDQEICLVVVVVVVAVVAIVSVGLDNGLYVFQLVQCMHTHTSREYIKVGTKSDRKKQQQQTNKVK